MLSRDKKKKHTTVRELAIGGGIVVLTSPIIITAIISALAGVGIGAMLMFNADPEFRSVFIRLFAVNAVVVVTIIWVLWRILQRTTLLTFRLRGLNQENKRINTLTNVQEAEARLSLDSIDEDFGNEDSDRRQAHFQQS